MALLASFLSPSLGHAADGVVTAAGLQFVPQIIVLPEGSGLLLANADPVAAAFNNGHNVKHNVVSPRFSTKSTVDLGETGRVEGVASLQPNDYPIICTIHPALMTGTLRIVAAT